MAAIYSFIYLLTQVLTIFIVIRAVLSWFPISPTNPLVAFIHQSTEPLLAPLRRVVPRLGMIDITPIVAIVLLQAINRIVVPGP